VEAMVCSRFFFFWLWLYNQLIITTKHSSWCQWS